MQKFYVKFINDKSNIKNSEAEFMKKVFIHKFFVFLELFAV